MTETALIVGGSSGIGLATARHLHGQGLGVTIAGRDPVRLETARAASASGIDAVSLDATDAASVRRVFASLGAIDHLILALGSGQGGGPFATVEMASVRGGFDEKVFPHFAVAQAALPTMAKGGSITFVSAVTAHAAMPGTAGLGAANAAIAALVPILAAELRPLRVNGVSPGVIDTSWWDFLSIEQRQAAFADYAGKTPVGRVGTPDDIASAIALLVTNSFMTGHVIVCDGGLRLAA